MAESSPTQATFSDDGIKIITAQDTANLAVQGKQGTTPMITPTQKKLLNGDLVGYKAEYDTIMARADMDGISDSTVKSAYQALTGLLTPLLADLESSSEVDWDKINSAINAYKSAVATFQQAAQSQYDADMANLASQGAVTSQVASSARSEAQSAVDKANNAVASAGFAVNVASESKEGAASAAVVATNAFSSAKDSQSQASGAVTQAKSALSQSTDALSKANSAISDGKVVSQKVTELQGGSKLTIAQLENGLAQKVSETTFNGMVIGGRNYLPQTSGSFTKHSTTYWNLEVLSVTNSDDLLVLQGNDVAVQATITDVTASEVQIEIWANGARIKESAPQTTDGSVANGKSGKIITYVKLPDKLTDLGVHIVTQNNGSGSASIKHEQLELGTKITDWSPAPEDYASTKSVSDLNGVVETHSTEIKQTADELAQKVDQTTYNGLTKTVTSQGTQIDQTAKQIALKADASKVDTISGQVTSQAAAIKVNADKITAGVNETNTLKNTVTTQGASITANKKAIDLKAEKSTVDTLAGTVATHSSQIKVAQDAINLRATKDELNTKTAGMATQSWTQGQIKVSSDSINSTVAKTQSQLDNLNLSNRNHLLATAGNISIVGKNTTNQTQTIYKFSESPNVFMKLGEKFTVGVDATVTGTNIAGTFGIQFDNLPWGMAGGQKATDYEKTKTFTFTMTITQAMVDSIADGIRIRLDNFVGTISITKVRLTLSSNLVDWSPAPEDLATVTQFSSIEQTVNGIQQTVKDNETNNQSKQTQLSNLITSSVSGLRNENLVPYSSLPIAGADGIPAGWTYGNGANGTGYLAVRKHSFYQSGRNSIFNLTATGKGKVYAKSQRFKLKPNTTYTVSLIAFAASAVSSTDVYLLARPSDSTSDYTVAFEPIAGKVFSPSNAEYITRTFKTNDVDEGYIRIDNNGSKDGTSAGLYFTEIKFEEGAKATPYEDSGSQIAQLKDDLNLRVVKGGVMSQLNLEAKKTILSSGGDLILSGDTVTFESPNPLRIPSANIADKLTSKSFESGSIIGSSIQSPDGGKTFSITKNGAYTGGSINIGSGKFTVSTAGALTATGATISGAINGSTINGSTFHSGTIYPVTGNVSKEYPLTLNNSGEVISTYFDQYAGQRAFLGGGSLQVSSEKFTSPYQMDRISLGNGLLNIFSGFNSAPNYSLNGGVSYIDARGQVTVSALSGINLWGDAQTIKFNGPRSETNTGILMTNHGHIRASSNQNYWDVGDSKGNPSIHVGTDDAGANRVQISREATVGNLLLGTGHTIAMIDGKQIGFRQGSATGQMLDVKVGGLTYSSLTKNSLLSMKTDVKRADTAYWAQLVNSIDLATYQYKTDDNSSHLRLSSIVDDVNDTSQWSLPDIFVTRDTDTGKRAGVDDSVLINALLATVQEQQKEISTINGHLLQLEATK